MSALPSVELAVTTSALLKAIGLLAVQFPEQFHVEAWRALTGNTPGERSDTLRAAQARAARLRRSPGDVKAVLQGAEPSPH